MKDIILRHPPTAYLITLTYSMNIWWKILIVTLSGGFGASCRLLIDLWLRPRLHGVWIGVPTLIINTLGCLIIGLCAGIVVKTDMSQTAKTIFALTTMTGFCGGFSTFSEFTLDCVRYFEEGNIGFWFLFGAATVLGGLMCCFFGYWLTKTYW